MTEIKQNRILLILASLVGGVGLGVLISFFVFPMNDADLGDSPSQEVRISTQTNNDEQASLATVSGDLEEIVEIEIASDRRGALYQMLENKSGDQIEELLRQSLNLDYSINLYSVQRLLFAELARIDPEKSLNLVWEAAPTRWSTFLNIVAMHWGMVSPEEALRTVSLLGEPWKSQAIEAVFDNQRSFTDTTIAEVVQTLDIADHFARWNYDTQLEAVIDEPRTAYNFAIKANTSEFHKRSMLLDITNRWIERAGTDDISSMLSLAYEIVNESRGLWIPVVTAIAAMNPELAWEQLSSMPTELQKQFKRYVFKVWVEHDPETAIQTITTKEYVAAEGSNFYSVLIPWIRAEADRLFENLELVPENFKTPAINLAVEHLAKSSPPSEVIELLAQLKSQGHVTDDATEEFVRIWSLDDPIAAFEWALENMDQENWLVQRTIEFALGRLSLSNPERAMELALEQPADMALEQGVVMTLLRQGKFDSALSLIPKIRTSPEYPSYYDGINQFLIVGGRIDDVLALADGLEESEKRLFYSSMARPWVRFEPESMLERLPKLPTAEMRKAIAQSVLLEQQFYPYLTEAEIEFITSFVPEETN
ncbi:MAG: hypothetical protein F4X56_08355 [Gammaproteobacteria bacterium]|nr:hypothetical protein [Gammaproteobacteria bacterium]MYC25911.1 hypothetical protein [Gammaproteobacteria bacterium]